MLADIIVQVIKALGIRTLPLVTIEKNLQSIAEQYELDVRTRLKENTWGMKEHIIRTKLLPYFGKRVGIGRTGPHGGGYGF